MQSGHNESGEGLLSKSRSYLVFSAVLFLLHAFLMLYRYGELPVAPVIGDEVIINEPAVALSRGQGLRAPSFRDSGFRIDKLYSHFPPVYLYAEAAAFRTFGVSVYSLRLTTTVMDLAATAVFLLLLYRLYLWRLVDWGTAALAALLYSLNASLIVLHRIARMESMVEFFLLCGLSLVIAGIYGGTEGIGVRWQGLEPGEVRRRSLCLFSGSILTGVAMATHPEALTATFPTLLLLLLASRMSWGLRAAAAAAAALTPAAIWIATYGARSREAVTEMGRILLHNTPPAGVLSLARDFFLETHRNKGEGMRATLFFLCLLVLEIALLRWATLERFAWKQSHELRPRAAERLLIARIFGISTLMTLVLLIWCLSASVTRYEVIFPVYLVGIAMTLRGFPATRLVSVSTKIVGGALTLTQFLAIAVYLHRDPGSLNLPSANRFDAVLKQIPPGMTVATTPMLWLAFQHEGRPITLLYRGFDGIDTWRAHGGNPLRQFDAVVLDTSFQGEYEDYSPYAAAQRVKHSYNCAGDQVDLYLPAAP